MKLSAPLGNGKIHVQINFHEEIYKTDRDMMKEIP